MSEKVHWQVVVDGVVQNRWAFSDADGTLKFSADDTWESRSHWITPSEDDLVMARQLLAAAERPRKAPRIVAGQALTPDDIVTMLETDAEQQSLIANRTQQMRMLDLLYPSQRQRLRELLEEVEQGTDAFIRASKYKLRMVAATEPYRGRSKSPPAACEEWFDGWGEGPLPTLEVERFVQQSPARAGEFHQASGDTYADLMGGPTMLRSSVNAGNPRLANLIATWLRNSVDVAASFVVALVWMMRSHK